MPEKELPHLALCAALVEARTRAGLTQRDLAARLKRVQSFVGKIENGSRQINVIEFIEVARALEIDPAKLLKTVIVEADL
jgi:transcriptional regulator with XRE-family HTH domain